MTTSIGGHPMTQAEIKAALLAPPVARDVYQRRATKPASKCAQCAGTGWWKGLRCRYCDGTGRA